MNRLLWILQFLLALLFLFAGIMKFVIPAEQLTGQMHMSVAFLRFIGVAEVLGAIGLILPRLLHIRPGLTPLAAALLVPIMIGAVVVVASTGPPVQALLPLVTGILCAFVAWGRWRVAP